MLTSLIGLDKVYETVIDFSKMSDTWDLGYWERYEELRFETLGKRKKTLDSSVVNTGRSGKKTLKVLDTD